MMPRRSDRPPLVVAYAEGSSPAAPTATVDELRYLGTRWALVCAARRRTHLSDPYQTSVHIPTGRHLLNWMPVQAVKQGCHGFLGLGTQREKSVPS
jgi:hypothetical protein